MKEKKKILFLITKGNFGGAQRYVFDLALYFSREYAVTVGMGAGGTLRTLLEQKGIRTISIPNLERNVNPLKDIRSFFSILSIIREEKPHILHLNSSKIGGMGSLAGRVCQVPHIIFTGHGWAFNEDRSLFSKVLITFFHWITIIFSHTTIAVSKRIEEQIIHLPCIKSKVVHIYNGIDSFFLEEKAVARKKIAPQISATTWIGTISELHKNKGLDFAIRGVAPLLREDPSRVFVVIGGGEELHSLKQLAVTLEIQKQVLLVGFISDARSLLKAFDIFTLTSRTDSFPYAPLEAGLAEVPVLASSVGGVPEIILPNETGILVEPRSSEAVTNGLSSLLEHPSLRSTLAKNLKKKVQEEFSTALMLKKTEELYKKSD